MLITMVSAGRRGIALRVKESRAVAAKRVRHAGTKLPEVVNRSTKMRGLPARKNQLTPIIPLLLP